MRHRALSQWWVRIHPMVVAEINKNEMNINNEI